MIHLNLQLTGVHKLQTLSWLYLIMRVSFSSHNTSMRRRQPCCCLIQAGACAMQPRANRLDSWSCKQRRHCEASHPPPLPSLDASVMEPSFSSRALLMRRRRRCCCAAAVSTRAATKSDGVRSACPNRPDIHCATLVKGADLGCPRRG